MNWNEETSKSELQVEFENTFLKAGNGDALNELKKDKRRYLDEYGYFLDQRMDDLDEQSRKIARKIKTIEIINMATIVWLTIVVMWMIMSYFLAFSDFRLFEDGSFSGCLPWAVCHIGG